MVVERSIAGGTSEDIYSVRIFCMKDLTLEFVLRREKSDAFGFIRELKSSGHIRSEARLNNSENCKKF